MKKTRIGRSLAVIFAVLLCCVLFQATAFGGESTVKAGEEKATEAVTEKDGDKSKEDSEKDSSDTIEIKTADQLVKLLTATDSKESAEKTYVLADDIKLDTSAFDTGDKDGHPKRQFAGTLNGKGHTVTVKAADKKSAPLFGYLNGTEKEPAKVTNLKLVISGDIAGTTVAAQTGAAEISNLDISVEGKILSSGSDKDAYTTGVFGNHSGKEKVTVSNVKVKYQNAELADDADLAAGVYSKDDISSGKVVLKSVMIKSTAEETTEEKTTEEKTTEEKTTEEETTREEPTTEEESVTLAADGFTVTFNMNGHGTQIDPKTVETGQKVEKPEDPTENGYTFDNWYAEEELTTIYDFDKEVTADITLYAKWTLNKYKVTFYDEDGTSVLREDEYDFGTKAGEIARPANPTKEGDAQYSYKFDKWVPELQDVTEDAAYKASYKATVNKYKVTFTNDDGTILKKAKAYKYGTAASDIAKPKDPTKKETAQYIYTFAGWSPALATVTQDVTYRATYSARIRTYQVTFNTNGHGTAPAAQTIQYNGFVSRPANMIAAGYTFSGWYLDSACTNAYNFSAPVTGNLTLYAKWVISQTVTTRYTTTGNNQPRTGDESNLTLWIILLVAAVVAGGAAIIYSKRKKNNG